MGTPYIGEIRMVGFSYAPPGWLPCNGQLLSIAEYSTLFALISTTYGGNAAHNNLPPYLAVNYCIALQGIFPQRP